MNPNSAQDLLQELLSICPKRYTAQKIMFGCPVIMVRNQMFAGIYENSLFIRVGEKEKLALISAGMAQPFNAQGREMRQYVSLPLPIDMESIAFSKLVRTALRKVEFTER